MYSIFTYEDIDRSTKKGKLHVLTFSNILTPYTTLLSLQNNKSCWQTSSVTTRCMLATKLLVYQFWHNIISILAHNIHQTYNLYQIPSGMLKRKKILLWNQTCYESLISKLLNIYEKLYLHSKSIWNNLETKD